MNWVDIVILVVVLGLAFVGLRMGIIRAVVMMVGMSLGIYLGGLFSGPLSQVLKQFISGENFARWAAFALIFVGCLVAATIVGRIVRTVLSLLFLGWVDKLAGLALGAAIGLTGMAALVVTIRALPFLGLDSSINKSQIGSYLADNYGLVRGLLPDELEKVKGLIPTGELPKNIIPGGLLPKTPTPGAK